MTGKDWVVTLIRLGVGVGLLPGIGVERLDVERLDVERLDVERICVDPSLL